MNARGHSLMASPTALSNGNIGISLVLLNGCTRSACLGSNRRKLGLRPHGPKDGPITAGGNDKRQDTKQPFPCVRIDI